MMYGMTAYGLPGQAPALAGQGHALPNQGAGLAGQAPLGVPPHLAATMATSVSSQISSSEVQRTPSLYCTPTAFHFYCPLVSSQRAL